MPDLSKSRNIAHAEVLREFQRIFSRLTGLSVTLVNLNADFITDDRGCRPFCLMMAEHEGATGISRCWQSNLAACRKVFRNNKPLVYRCHAGLTEILVPIIVNDKAVGALLTGQIRVAGQGSFPSGLFKGSAPAQVRRFAKAYRRIPGVSRRTVEAYAELLSFAANHILRAENLLAFSGAGRHRSYMQEVIDRALRYLCEHFREPDLSLNRVAEEVHLSPFYFSHIFRKTLRSTFIDYLTRLRMEETVRLFRESPGKSIKEIAFSAGYEDPYYFSKVFRKTYHLSPTRFRQQFLPD